MKINHLYNLIKISGPILSSGYMWLVIARELSKSCEYSGTWFNWHIHKQISPNILKETTYSECVDVLFFDGDNRSVIMKITLFDGDMTHGQRIEKRCMFTLKLTHSFEELDELIDVRLNDLAVELCRREDENAFKRRVQKTKTHLLKDVS